MLRNYCKDNFEMTLKKNHMKVFRQICSGMAPAEVESKIENEKCDKNQFKRFLEARYDKRLALKILALFDWSVNLKFEKFTERVHEFILKPRSDGGDNDYSESVRTLKLLAFNLFDMNNDGMLCESDLFSLLRCTQKDKIFNSESEKDDFFKQVIYDDILAIQERLIDAKNNLYDPVFVNSQKPDADLKIRDIKNFLGVQKLRRENQVNLG